MVIKTWEIYGMNNMTGVGEESVNMLRGGYFLASVQIILVNFSYFPCTLSLAQLSPSLSCHCYLNMANVRLVETASVILEL